MAGYFILGPILFNIMNNISHTTILRAFFWLGSGITPGGVHGVSGIEPAPATCQASALTTVLFLQHTWNVIDGFKKNLALSKIVEWSSVPSEASEKEIKERLTERVSWWT